MRVLILLVFITLLSCSKNEPEAGNEPFKKLPFNLSTNFRDSIAKKITPGQNYTYWAYCSLRQPLSGEERHTILSRGGDSLQKFEADRNKPIYGFFQGGYPGYSTNYVLINDNGKKEVVETQDGFREFLGAIDNLEEAVLLAFSYGYRADTDIKGNAWCMHNGNYELHLVKYSDYPQRKESVEVIITKDGFIKTNSLGIYCKDSSDCY